MMDRYQRVVKDVWDQNDVGGKVVEVRNKVVKQGIKDENKEVWDIKENIRKEPKNKLPWKFNNSENDSLPSRILEMKIPKIENGGESKSEKDYEIQTFGKKRVRRR